MSTAITPQQQLTKRQRIEFEIFDKSIKDIETLFSPELKPLPPLKKVKWSTTTPRPLAVHTPSLFTKPPKAQPTQANTNNTNNYTYKHSNSYTSLFSHGKTLKSSDTSLDNQQQHQHQHQPSATVREKAISNKNHATRENISGNDLKSAVAKKVSLLHGTEQQQHQHPTKNNSLMSNNNIYQSYGALMGDPASIKNNVHVPKNWSLWRSEVMIMIDFYANDLQRVTPDETQDDVESEIDSFATVVGDILLKK